MIVRKLAPQLTTDRTVAVVRSLLILPGRIRSEAARTLRRRPPPSPASSQTVRYRLDRSGDRVRGSPFPRIASDALRQKSLAHSLQ